MTLATRRNILKSSPAVGALVMHSAIDIPIGIQLPVGAGLKSVAAAGNTGAIDVRGAIYYTQQ